MAAPSLTAETTERAGPRAAPASQGVLETALYLDDLRRGRLLYEEMMGLEAIFADQRVIELAIVTADRPRWVRQLEAHKVTIERKVTWPKGGISISFRDPEGHLLEIATPGLWRHH